MSRRDYNGMVSFVKARDGPEDIAVKDLPYPWWIKVPGREAWRKRCLPYGVRTTKAGSFLVHLEEYKVSTVHKTITIETKKGTETVVISKGGRINKQKYEDCFEEDEYVVKFNETLEIRPEWIPRLWHDYHDKLGHAGWRKTYETLKVKFHSHKLVEFVNDTKKVCPCPKKRLPKSKQSKARLHPLKTPKHDL